MTSRSLTIGVIVMLVAVVAIGAYVRKMGHRAAVEPPPNNARPVAPPVAGPTEAVTLYVAYDNPGILLPESAHIALPEGRQQRARELLQALLSRYLEKTSPHILAAGSDIRDVYLVDPGLAVIDLNADFANNHRSGVLIEELTIASFVQTLAASTPGILHVKFLVDGKERETLAGHADLSTTYDVSSINEMVSSLQASQ